MRFFPSIYIAAGAQPSVFHGWFVPSEAVAVFKKKKKINKIRAFEDALCESTSSFSITGAVANNELDTDAGLQAVVL